jgi:hypothetical protein
MIDKLSWYERKNKNDTTTSLGYGARFDPLFKGVKIHDERDVVKCVFDVPWWMTNDELPQLKNAMKVLRKYHTVPNVHESEPEFEGDEDKEAYLDYIKNAGPKHADRKKKSMKSKPKRKIIKKCKCK